MLDYFDRDREYLLNEYSYNNWSSGSKAETIKSNCEKIVNKFKGKSVQKIKSHLIEYILTNAQIEISEKTLYADKINHLDILENYKWFNKALVEDTEIKATLEKYKYSTDSYVLTGDADFSHTCPNWNTVLKLGLKGILDKINESKSGLESNDSKYEFFECMERVYRAAIVYVERLSDEAQRVYEKTSNENIKLMSLSLKNLSLKAPTTTYEALQLICIFYMLQQHFDATNVRSLGGLDTLLYPFYLRDIKTGTAKEHDIRIYLKYFMAKMSAKNAIANIPFYLCGRDLGGKDMTNKLTHIILDEYILLNIDDPKIHIRYHDGIDKDIVSKVLKAIRNGNNSFVFMNDDIIEKALIKIGAEKTDARQYTIIGCYEPAALGEVPCSCSGRINIAQIVMLTLTDGIDLLSGKRLIPKKSRCLESFNDFMVRLKENLIYFSECTIDIINEYEKNYYKIHTSPFFTGTFDECIKQGKDVYEGSAKYNNSSISAFGLATAVDSVIVIKKAIFEEKTISIDGLIRVLETNWKDNEALRLKFANLYPKYGNNNALADDIMLDIFSTLESTINNRKNARGGVYRLGLFSIDWRFFFGKCTPATPDGRFAKTTISKNLCSVIACDKAGVTSLINSVTKIDYTKVPDGSVLDIILHYSSVADDAGLAALLGLLCAYFKNNGNAIQFNVLNPDKLREAQKYPDKYKTLQVRLCGWNVYFVDLSKEEQDEFIKQTEHMGA